MEARCPRNCGSQLLMTERHGVEIDYCPTCRGVWLDRGELDKIMERAIAMEMSTAQPPAPTAQPSVPGCAPPIPQTPAYQPQQTPTHYRDSYHHKHKKKKHFLEEMFDFD